MLKKILSIPFRSFTNIMLYKVIIYNALLIISSWAAQGGLGKCRDGVTKEVSPHQLLRQDLFCSYDKESRPVKDFHKYITLEFNIIVLSFFLDEHKNILDLHTWVIMEWIDEGLKWNSADYSNVDVLHVKSYDIWQPDISIYNSGNLEKNRMWDYTYCTVNSTGEVLCIPNVKWSAQCITNLQQWPFDKHICNMTIGSWTHTGEHMNIKHFGGVGLKYMTKNPEWKILNSSANRKVSMYDCCPNSTYQSINISFHIERHAGAYAATVVMPSLVLTLLTLTSYWLNPRKTNRLALCCTSTLCHCLYLQYLGLKLPINGTMTPKIILLYRDSLILTIIALVLAIIVEKLPSSTNETSSTYVQNPPWLERFAGVVLNQKAGQLLLLGRFYSKRGDGASLIENGPKPNEEKGNQDWFILVTIIDRLCFLISLIIYFVLHIAFIPKY